MCQVLPKKMTVGCIERDRLINERVQHVNRIKGLCAVHGIYDYEPLRPNRLARLPGRIVSRRPVLRAVAFFLRLLPTCSAEDLHLQSRVHAWHTNPSRLRRDPAGFRG